MVMLVMLLQPEKALLPMLVTLLGMVTPVKLLQPVKALFPMLATPLFITIFTMDCLSAYQGLVGTEA
jgi:hypothetical protein